MSNKNCTTFNPELGVVPVVRVVGKKTDPTSQQIIAYTSETEIACGAVSPLIAKQKRDEANLTEEQIKAGFMLTFFPPLFCVHIVAGPSGCGKTVYARDMCQVIRDDPKLTSNSLPGLSTEQIRSIEEAKTSEQVFSDDTPKSPIYIVLSAKFNDTTLTHGRKMGIPFIQVHIDPTQEAPAQPIRETINRLRKYVANHGSQSVWDLPEHVRTGCFWQEGFTPSADMKDDSEFNGCCHTQPCSVMEGKPPNKNRLNRFKRQKMDGSAASLGDSDNDDDDPNNPYAAVLKAGMKEEETASGIASEKQALMKLLGIQDSKTLGFSPEMPKFTTIPKNLKRLLDRLDKSRDHGVKDQILKRFKERLRAANFDGDFEKANSMAYQRHEEELAWLQRGKEILITSAIFKFLDRHPKLAEMITTLDSGGHLYAASAAEKRMRLRNLIQAAVQYGLVNSNDPEYGTPEEEFDSIITEVERLCDAARDEVMDKFEKDCDFLKSEKEMSEKYMEKADERLKKRKNPGQSLKAEAIRAISSGQRVLNKPISCQRMLDKEISTEESSLYTPYTRIVLLIDDFQFGTKATQTGLMLTVQEFAQKGRADNMCIFVVTHNLQERGMHIFKAEFTALTTFPSFKLDDSLRRHLIGQGMPIPTAQKLMGYFAANLADMPRATLLMYGHPFILTTKSVTEPLPMYIKENDEPLQLEGETSNQETLLDDDNDDEINEY